MLCLLFALVCAGCASSVPCRFYQLSSLKAEGVASNESSHEKRITVAIGPLRIPDYLDRPQIVTRSAANELRLAEFDRWAGSLEKDTDRVLVEDISALLPADRFLVIPWVSASESAGSSLYRIEINIIRFEGTLGGSVSLKAQWAIFHREKGLLLRRESIISEQVHGASYGALVTALSDALTSLSREIAHAITSF
jgi:uncharacterized lipoprotein YmbA